MSRATTVTNTDTGKSGLVITWDEDDIIEICPWLSKGHARSVLTRLVTGYGSEFGINNATVRDTVTNMGYDKRYALETRVSHNDQWTCVLFETEKALSDECLYKLKNGWEVRLPSHTVDLCNES